MVTLDSDLSRYEALRSHDRIGIDGQP